MEEIPLPSMRIIYFSNQSPEVVNAVIEGLEALGQQVLLLVTTPGPRARPGNEYKRKPSYIGGKGMYALENLVDSFEFLFDLR